jgi:signal transduction histidine kinase
VRVSAGVGARIAGGRVTVSVADEGVGISAADLPHVFDSFYRAQHGDSVVPGTGLGLAIARGLIEVMGGRITAVSPVPEGFPGRGRGTLVTITLAAVR